jgi:HprK-related kinase A
MLTVGMLAPAELQARLAGDGLVLRTGPFTNLIRSDVPRLIDSVALMYADYPVEPGGGFVDFHLDYSLARGMRRWFRPQVRFSYDGSTPFQPLPLAQAYPMLEWTMNWCVSQRAHTYLIIHAAVLEKHGRTIILPAPSGSGKSTLTAALLGHGWRLLSDEMTLVDLDDGHVVPLPRPVSLKNASIGIIRAFRPDAVLSRPVEQTTKGTIAHLRVPAESIARAAEPARPACIIFPRWEAGAAMQLELLPKARAFMQVADNCFNYPVLGVRGFEALGRLIDTSDAHLFRYSSLPDAMGLFERLAQGRA